MTTTACAVDGAWDVALVRTAYDAHLMDRGPLVWPELVHNLTEPGEWKGEKKDLPGWIPARFRQEETRRHTRGVEAVSMLVLDLDAGDVGVHGETAERVVESVGCAGIFHTSWSHTPAKPKGRLVMPLDRPCPADRWAETWQSAARWAAAQGLTVDPAAKDASRLYYMAMKPPGGGHFAAWARPGRVLSWRWLVAHHAPPREAVREFRPVLPTAQRGLDGQDMTARRRRFAIGVVQHRAREIAVMGEGGRNQAVFRAAAAVGQLHAAGVLDLRDAVEEIRRAGLASGLSEGEVSRTINSGLSRGASDGPWDFKTT